MPVADAPDRKTLGDANAVLKLCSELEGELAALRAKWEQYFLGVERRPPTDDYEAFKKRLNGLKLTFVRQVAVKFKVANITTKFQTYDRLWQRTIAEMEAGTYRRDVFKARLRRKGEEAAKKKSTQAHGLDSEDVDLNDLDDDEELTDPGDALDAAFDAAMMPDVKPAAAKAPVAAAQAKVATPLAKPGTPVAGKPAVNGVAPAKPNPLSVPPKPPGSGSQVSPVAAKSGELSDAKVKAIYDAYVMAKKRCNEDVSKLSLDSLASTLRKQVPQLMQQHKAKSVEFKVVIKDGKAILRALPKE